MEEKKETQEKKPPVPPVKKSKPTTSTKRTVKATVKKPIQCKLCQVPNHTNLYYSVEKGSAEVKFFREVKPRKPRKAKETGEQMETKSRENVQNEQKTTEEKTTEEKTYPIEIREKVIEEREMADKVAQYITSGKETESTKTMQNTSEQSTTSTYSSGENYTYSIPTDTNYQSSYKTNESENEQNKYYTYTINTDNIDTNIDSNVASYTNANPFVSEVPNSNQNANNNPIDSNNTDNASQTQDDEPPTDNNQPTNSENNSEKKEEDNSKSNDNTPTNNKVEEKPKDNASEAKKEEPKKKVLNINKHLVRFLGLLCATGAFFLVSPVLMFVALMLFEASFIMQSIEYNEFRPKRPPMSRREKNMEKIAKYENTLTKNQLSNEEISWLEQGKHIKGRKNKKIKLGEQGYESFKTALKKQREFDKASKKLNRNPYMTQSAKDFMKEQEFIQSMNSNNDKFEKAKQSYLDKVQRLIDTRKQMVEQIKADKIKVDDSQLAIINDEIKSCQEYLDSVSSSVVNSDYIQNKNYLDYYHRTMDPSFLGNVGTNATFENSMEEQKDKLTKPTLNKEVFESLQASIATAEKEAQDKAQVKEAEQKQNSNDEEITK